MKLLVVISSYRVTDLTIDCLRSLSEEISRVPGGARVALCENGTGADAAEQMQRVIAENGWGSWVELTVIYPNRGFTGGSNAVIRPALQSDDPPEYILLLNADTIVQEHALATLVSFMDANPAAGIAASMEISSDGRGHSSAFRFPGIATELDRGLRIGFLRPAVVALQRLPSTRIRTSSRQATRPSPAAGPPANADATEDRGLLDERLYATATIPTPASVLRLLARPGSSSLLELVNHHASALTGVMRSRGRSHDSRSLFRQSDDGQNYAASLSMLIFATIPGLRCLRR